MIMPQHTPKLKFSFNGINLKQLSNVNIKKTMDQCFDLNMNLKFDVN